MSTGASRGHVIEADFERGGHGAETGPIVRDKIGRYMTDFDRDPFRRLHAGQAGGIFNRPADSFAAVLDHAAEQLTPGAVCGGGWGVRH